MSSLPGLNTHLPGLKLQQFTTILADPPWQFQNRTGKVAPEHKRLRRYRTMSLAEIMAMPVAHHAAEKSHLYLWCPNALLQEGLGVMRAWGFKYKANIVWHKIRKDGGPDGRGVGFYFRNVTELLLFGIRGSMRTLKPGRTQVNILKTRKQEHSRKPDEMYEIIEACSPGPFLELFGQAAQGLDPVGRRARHLLAHATALQGVQRSQSPRTTDRGWRKLNRHFRNVVLIAGVPDANHQYGTHSGIAGCDAVR